MSARKHYITVYSDRTGERIVSPGEILTKELRRQRITQKELSVLLGRSEKFISQLITGKVRLTYDVAYDLERTLKVPTAKWNAAEAALQDVLTRGERLKELDTPETIAWIASFPYEKMVEEGLVPACEDAAKRACNILTYFGVASPSAYEACLTHEKGLSHFRQCQAEIEALS
jgi:plasmid maintenance system antidote protein VapI